MGFNGGWLLLVATNSQQVELDEREGAWVSLGWWKWLVGLEVVSSVDN